MNLQDLSRAPACKVIINDRLITFDKFSAAIAFLSPACSRCGSRMIGHGVDIDGQIICDACLIQSENNLESILTE